MLSRTRLLILFFCSTLAAFYIFGIMVVAPTYLKNVITKQVNQNLNGKLTVTKLSINPFTHAITLSDIKILDLQGIKVLSLKRGMFNLQVFPLLARQIHLKKIVLDQPTAFLDTSNMKVNKQLLELIDLGSVTIVDARIAIDTNQIHIESIVASKGNINIEKASINLLIEKIQTLLPTKQLEPSDTTPTNPWQITALKSAIKKYTVQFTDTTTDEHAILSFTDTNMTLDKFNSTLVKPVSFTITSKFIGGKIHLAGLSNIKLKHISGTLNIEELPLQPLEPYIKQYTRLKLLSAYLDYSGEMDLRLDKETMLANLSGDALVMRPKINYAPTNSDLLSCEKIYITNSNIDLQPPAISIQNITLKDCELSSYFFADGSNNLKFFRDNPTQIETENETPSALDIQIGIIDMNESRLYISDETQTPPFIMEMEDLTISIRNLKKGAGDASNFQFSGELNNQSLLNITGNGNFLNPSPEFQANISLNNLSMSQFSTYSLSLGKRSIEQGLITLNLNYTLKENIITGQNAVRINQLNLSKKHKTSSGGNLPIGLAASVLKDQKDIINLNVSAQGDLSDPEFSVRGLLLKAFTNVIIKTTTAPLSIVTGLVQANENDLQRMYFAPGKDTLAEKYGEKLDAISKAFKQKQDLILHISAHIHPEDDLAYLQKFNLYSKIEKKTGENIGPEQLIWNNSVFQPVIEELYVDLQKETKEQLPPATSIKRNQLNFNQAYKIMLDHLLHSTSINPDKLTLLVRQRALHLKEELIKRGLPEKRTFLTHSNILADHSKGAFGEIEIVLP